MKSKPKIAKDALISEWDISIFKLDEFSGTDKEKIDAIFQKDGIYILLN